MILVVRLTPKSSENRLDGWVRDASDRWMLCARVRARPVEGEANLALEHLLAEALGLARRDVRVVRGASARCKAVEVSGMTEADLIARLGPREPLA